MEVKYNNFIIKGENINSNLIEFLNELDKVPNTDKISVAVDKENNKFVCYAGKILNLNAIRDIIINSDLSKYQPLKFNELNESMVYSFNKMAGKIYMADEYGVNCKTFVGEIYPLILKAKTFDEFINMDSDYLEISKELADNNAIKYMKYIDNTPVLYIKNILAVDVSYFEKDGKEYGRCAAVLYDAPNHKEIDKVVFTEETEFPYKFGMLRYREYKFIEKAVNKILKKDNYIDLLLIDGNGQFHEHKMGLATFAGININIPTIGVAKDYIGDNRPSVENKKGNFAELKIDNEIVGYALQTKNGGKPLYISKGYCVSLQQCKDIILDLCPNKQKLPEPLRLAHLYSRHEEL